MRPAISIAVTNRKNIVDTTLVLFKGFRTHRSVSSLSEPEVVWAAEEYGRIRDLLNADAPHLLDTHGGTKSLVQVYVSAPGLGLVEALEISSYDMTFWVVDRTAPEPFRPRTTRVARVWCPSEHLAPPTWRRAGGWVYPPRRPPSEEESAP